LELFFFEHFLWTSCLELRKRERKIKKISWRERKKILKDLRVTLDLSRGEKLGEENRTKIEKLIRRKGARKMGEKGKKVNGEREENEEILPRENF
jgi:hypothetical protein